MNLKTLFFGFMLVIPALSAVAGSGHDHGHDHSHAPAAVSQEVVINNASQVVTSLVEKKKLEESWTSVKAKSAEKKLFNNKPEWVITFVNDAITDVKKQTLYIFLTPGGEYIAANFTGN